MTRPAIENIDNDNDNDIHEGSGNVFADLGLKDADKLKIKSGLTVEITKAVRRLELTQSEAAHRMGISQPKVSALLRGEFANLSERKLMDEVFLARTHPINRPFGGIGKHAIYPIKSMKAKFK